MLHLPFHYVLGMFNTLNKMEKDEHEAAKNQQAEGGFSPSSFMPRNVSVSGPTGTSNLKFK